MSTKAYRISAEAINDLEKIWEYTCNKWSLKQADRYYSLLIDEIQFLCRNPYAGKAVGHIRKEYRSSVVKSHLIFYKISNDKVLEVIRILHQSMDIDERMK